MQKQTQAYQNLVHDVKAAMNLNIPKDKIIIRSKVDMNETLIAVTVATNSPVLVEDVSVEACPLRGPNDPPRNCIDFERSGIYNKKKREFTALEAIGYPISTIYSQLVRESRAYGCNQDYPLQKIDMDFDGNPELWFIGGKGEYHTDGEFDFTNYVLMFSTKNLEQPLFSSEIVRILSSPMHQETIYYSPAGRVGNYNRKTHKITTASDVGPAKRMYTKFYVGDFNENKKADLMVWKRHYQSRLQTTRKPGYEFTHESLELHEMHEGKYKQLDLKQEEIKSLFKKHGLSWRKGLPNVNRCRSMKPDDALIMTQGFDSEIIDDPVLKQ